MNIWVKNTNMETCNLFLECFINYIKKFEVKEIYLQKLNKNIIEHSYSKLKSREVVHRYI